MKSNYWKKIEKEYEKAYNKKVEAQEKCAVLKYKLTQKKYRDQRKEKQNA